MLCAKPFRRGLEEWACGSCDRCLAYRRRVWTTRILLEQAQHDASSFLTLTYKEVPEGFVWRGRSYRDGSVSPKDVQEFLKRLRYYALPSRLRYFGVGEYGTSGTRRPHYHLALFGMATRETVELSWNQGHVLVGTLTPASAAYVVSYVLKGMTRKDSPALGGLYPEFAFMSRRPGIGHGAVKKLVEGALAKGQQMFSLEDLPSSLRSDGSLWPLGRYVLGKMNYALGLARIGYASRAVGEQLTSFAECGTIETVRRREELRTQHGRVARKRREIAESKGKL